MKFTLDDHLVTSGPLNVATGTEVSLVAHVVKFELFSIAFGNSSRQICIVKHRYF